MGRGNNKRRGGGRHRGNSKRGRGDRGGRGGGRSDNWAPELLENELFESYYKEQKICPEDEWPELLKYMRKQLPMTFRINGSGRFAENLIKKLSSDFLGRFSAADLVVEGETVSAPKPLPWYPNNLAWQFDFSRSHLRRIPEMKEMHEFIKAETEIGAITRQEAVSMVPPLFLDVRPHHRVLDMCAAPGSKTFQMLEALHDTPNLSNDISQRGLVVGNDADSRRCATLTHQAQRMRSPSLVVTNHEAQNFPTILDTDPTSDDSQYMWDRILCDVPCSGDGTVRKQPDIWSRWSQSNGNGLHLLQLKIAMRAAELLKVGGRMVYSTCTFNPIEDEAVVAELLRRTHGGLRLVDVSEIATKLRFQPGVTSWKVMDGGGRWHDSWETAKFNPKLSKTMFPKGDETELGLSKTMRFLPHYQDTGGFYVAVFEKIKDMPPLLYPVANKTLGSRRGLGGNRTKPKVAVSLNVLDGGKVTIEVSLVSNDLIPDKLDTTVNERDEPDGVAITKRVRPVRREDKVLPVWGPRGVTQVVCGEKTSIKAKWKGTDPILPYSNADVLASIAEFYGLSADAPVIQNLVARSPDPFPKKLVYLGAGPKLFLQMDDRHLIKTINAGVKIFERQDSKGAQAVGSCRYRISQEGIHVVLPFMTKQIIHLGVAEFLMLLRDRSVWYRGSDEGDGSDGRGVQTGDNITEEEPTEKKPRPLFKDPQTLDVLSKIQSGCCVALLSDEDLQSLGLTVRGEDSSVTGSLRSAQPFVLPCWKGQYNVGVMVSKIDCQQMLDRIQSAMDDGKLAT